MSQSADFGLTLTQHVMANQDKHPDARGQLSALLTQIGVAGKLISAQVRRAGLIELWSLLRLWIWEVRGMLKLFARERL